MKIWGSGTVGPCRKRKRSAVTREKWVTISNLMVSLVLSGKLRQLKKPWIKLDRALKIDRLKAFAEAYDATAEEKQRLTQCLLVSLDRGLLKTRQIVIYNTETCKIDEIKGLTLTTSDAGLRTFKVEIPRATKRRTRTAQTQETGENPQEK